MADHACGANEKVQGQDVRASSAGRSLPSSNFAATFRTIEITDDIHFSHPRNPCALGDLCLGRMEFQAKLAESSLNKAIVNHL